MKMSVHQDAIMSRGVKFACAASESKIVAPSPKQLPAAPSLPMAQSAAAATPPMVRPGSPLAARSPTAPSATLHTPGWSISTGSADGASNSATDDYVEAEGAPHPPPARAHTTKPVLEKRPSMSRLPSLQKMRPMLGRATTSCPGAAGGTLGGGAPALPQYPRSKISLLSSQIHAVGLAHEALDARTQEMATSLKALEEMVRAIHEHVIPHQPKSTAFSWNALLTASPGSRSSHSMGQHDA